MPDRSTPAFTPPSYRGNRSPVDAAFVSSKNQTNTDRITLGVRLHHSKRNAEAAEVFRGILQETPDHAESLQLLGWIEAEEGDVTSGIAKMHRAIELSPKSELYYLNLLNLLKSQGEFKEAEQVVAKMLSALPESPKAYSQLAILQERRGAVVEAERSRLRAIDLAPQNANLMGELAHMLELQNRLEDSAEWARKGLALDPTNEVCRLVTAKNLRRAGRKAQALSLMASTPELKNAAFQFELGLLCDANQRHADAFRHWDLANQMTVETYGCAANGDLFLNEVLALTELYQPSLVAGFSQVAAPPQGQHVFVTGFPRSGTSLMHHRLSQASGVVARHEPRTVYSVKVAMKQLNRGYPASIATMTDAEASFLAGVYTQVHAASHSGATDAQEETPRAFVDTNPQHLIDVGLLLRLFPESHFVYVIRHPLDVVLSCFMQNFRYSHFTANFVSVERAAQTYHHMFSLWRNTVRQFPHPCRILRYEELVAAPEKTLAELHEWLGWPRQPSSDSEIDSGVHSVTDSARNSQIGTPSYHQVVQPIYKSAAGRWRNYAPQLKAAAEFLAPWIEYFGYEA